MYPSKVQKKKNPGDSQTEHKKVECVNSNLEFAADPRIVLSLLQVSLSLTNSILNSLFILRGAKVFLFFLKEQKMENDSNNKMMGEGELKTRNKKEVLLFYCMECEELARKIAAHSQLITLQSINWRYSSAS